MIETELVTEGRNNLVEKKISGDASDQEIYHGDVLN